MKLYANRAWLSKRLYLDRLSIEDIAKEAGCTQQTIYTYMKKFNLKF